MESDEEWEQFEIRVKLKRLTEHLKQLESEIANISKIQQSLNEKAYRLRLRISEAEDTLNMPAKSWHTNKKHSNKAAPSTSTDFFSDFPSKPDFNKKSTRKFDPRNASFFRVSLDK